MQSLRQIGLAIAVAVVSLGVVLGGLSLALSENVSPPAETPTLWLPTFAEFITPTATPEVLPSETQLVLLPSLTATLLPPPTSCAPPSGWIGITVGINDTLEGIAARHRTTTQALIQGNCLLSTTLVSGSVLFAPPLPIVSVPSSTAVPCGAPFGWVRYTVLAGDTLYHISTMYGITTSRLQQANCLGSSTYIRVGQLLWIPNTPPLFTNTPLVPPTIYVPSETPTEQPTQTATEQPSSTPEPTQTTAPTATLTPITPQP